MFDRFELNQNFQKVNSKERVRRLKVKEKETFEHFS